MSFKLNEITHTSHFSVASPSKSMVNLLGLPIEIIRKIISNLSSKDIVELSLSCKSMFMLCRENTRSITFYPHNHLIERINKWFSSEIKDRFLYVNSMNVQALSCTEESIQALAHKFPGVRRMKPFRDLSDDGLALICRLFPDLEALDLSEINKITHQGFMNLRLLTNLKELNVSYSEITDETLEFLFTEAPSIEDQHSLKNTLTSLKLLNCTEVTQRGLQYLRSLTCLKELNLDSNDSVTDAILAIIGTLTKLENLSLFNCFHITEAGFEHLASLNRLKKLDIGGNNPALNMNVTDATLAIIGTLTNLESLQLYDCISITNRGFQCLVSLIDLKQLDISGEIIYADETIEIVGTLSKLESLKLSNNSRMTERGAQYLRSLTNLIELELCSSEFLKNVDVLTSFQYLRYLTLMTLPLSLVQS